MFLYNIETYHYEASVEESSLSSSEDDESEIEEEPHDQISQAVLLVQNNQTVEQDIIPCQHPHSIFEQDIQIETKQPEVILKEEQKENMVPDTTEQDIPQATTVTTEQDVPQTTSTTEQEMPQAIDVEQQESITHAFESKQDDDDLSIEIVPNDEEVVESLTIDTSSLNMPPIDKEEELSLSSSCSTTPPKTPPSSSHHSSYLNKSKTTTSLFRRETKKLNERRKSLGKKLKSALHSKPTKRFTI
jgi:hypothetical protein